MEQASVPGVMMIAVPLAVGVGLSRVGASLLWYDAIMIQLQPFPRKLRSDTAVCCDGRP
jgi:hypothetical protein